MVVNRNLKLVTSANFKQLNYRMKLTNERTKQARVADAEGGKSNKAQCYLRAVYMRKLAPIRAAAILAIDNRFRTPSLELKCLRTRFGAQRQKFSIPWDSTWPACD